MLNMNPALRVGIKRIQGFVHISPLGGGNFFSFLVAPSPSHRALRINQLHDAPKNGPDGSTCKSLRTSSILSSASSSSSHLTKARLPCCSNLIKRQFFSDSPLNQEIRTVPAPQFAESITEGDLRWEKAVGDAVAEDELIAEVETDKTTVPINSPVAGTIEELLVEDGSTVKSGQPIFKIKVGAVAASKPQPQKMESAAPPPPPPSTSPSPPETASSVHAPPSTPPPIPPQPAAPMSTTPVSSIKPSFTPPSSAIPLMGQRQEERVKMNRMRQRIAQRLKDAQNTYAMLTTFNEIDMR